MSSLKGSSTSNEGLLDFQRHRLQDFIRLYSEGKAWEPAVYAGEHILGLLKAQLEVLRGSADLQAAKMETVLAHIIHFCDTTRSGSYRLCILRSWDQHFEPSWGQSYSQMCLDGAALMERILVNHAANIEDGTPLLIRQYQFSIRQRAQALTSPQSRWRFPLGYLPWFGGRSEADILAASDELRRLLSDDSTPEDALRDHAGEMLLRNEWKHILLVLGDSDILSVQARQRLHSLLSPVAIFLTADDEPVLQQFSNPSPQVQHFALLAIAMDLSNLQRELNREKGPLEAALKSLLLEVSLLLKRLLTLSGELSDAEDAHNGPLVCLKDVQQRTDYHLLKPLEYWERQMAAVGDVVALEKEAIQHISHEMAETAGVLARLAFFQAVMGSSMETPCGPADYRCRVDAVEVVDGEDQAIVHMERMLPGREIETFEGIFPLKRLALNGVSVHELGQREVFFLVRDVQRHRICGGGQHCLILPLPEIPVTPEQESQVRERAARIFQHGLEEPSAAT